MEQEPTVSGVKCGKCASLIQRSIICNSCHHYAKAHGILVESGKRVKKMDYLHVCPKGMDGKPFICKEFNNCPTAARNKHLLEREQNKNRLNALAVPNSQELSKMTSEERTKRLKEELEKATEQIASREKELKRNALCFQFSGESKNQQKQEQPEEQQQQKRQRDMMQRDYSTMTRTELEEALAEVEREVGLLKRRKRNIIFNLQDFVE